MSEILDRDKLLKLGVPEAALETAEAYVGSVRQKGIHDGVIASYVAWILENWHECWLTANDRHVKRFVQIVADEKLRAARGAGPITTDREALKERAQAMLDVPREKRFGSEWDEIVARYDRIAGPSRVLSLLTELEAAERDITFHAKRHGEIAHERNQLEAERERLCGALQAVAVSKFATEPHRIARDALESISPGKP